MKYQFTAERNFKTMVDPVKVRNTKAYVPYVTTQNTREIIEVRKITVEIDIDTDTLGRWMADKCSRTKNRQSRVLHGLIRAKLLTQETISREEKEIAIGENYERVEGQ